VVYQVVEELNDRFLLGVGVPPREKLDHYLVINKQYGVIEYISPILFHAKEWAKVMAEAMDKTETGENITSFPPPNNNGQFN